MSIDLAAGWVGNEMVIELNIVLHRAVTEFASPKYRSTLSIFFSVSYPIGMTLLALAAYLVRPWRLLQWTLSVPAFLLVVHFL